MSDFFVKVGLWYGLGLGLVLSSSAAVQLEPGPDGSTTIIVLPDTQYYYNDQSAGNFAKWYAQVNWIRSESANENLAYVLHLGDITDQSDHSSTHIAQWQSARSLCGAIMQTVPMALATGNHDGLDDSRNSMFSDPELFGKGSLYAEQRTLIETMETDKYENSVHQFEIGDRKWMVITLEWGPRDAVMEWADEVLSRYADRSAIVITHAFLFRDSNRFDWDLLGDDDYSHGQSGNPLRYDGMEEDPEGTNDGQRIWNKVLRKHANVSLVMSGHVSRSGHGRRIAVGDAGQLVQQHLVNFQHWEGDGNGFMRALRIHPDGETVDALSFSPYTEAVLTAPDLKFRFALPKAPLASSYLGAVEQLGAYWQVDLSTIGAGAPILSKAYPTVLRGTGLKGATAAEFSAGMEIDGKVEGEGLEAWTLALWGQAERAGRYPLAEIVDGEGQRVALEMRVMEREEEPVTELSRIKWEEKRLTMEVPRGHWNHIALRNGELGWELILNGESVYEASGGMLELSELVLGGGAETAVEGEWKVDGVTLFSRALSFSDISWMRYSAYREVLETGGRYPGLVVESTNEEIHWGINESSYYRIPNVVGASRDPYERFIPRLQSLEYSEGVLLVNDGGTGRSNVSLSELNRYEGQYMGDAYKDSWQSLLHSKEMAEGDVQGALFFPFGGEILSGYVTESGQLFYGSEELSSEGTSSYSVVSQGYRLAIPDGESGGTLFLQSGREGIIVAATAEETGWLVSGFRSEGNADRLRSPFAFVWIPEGTESGIEAGTVNPSENGIGENWERLETGVYRFDRAGEAGALWINAHDDLSLSRPAKVEVEEEVEGIWKVTLTEAETGTRVDGGFSWMWKKDATGVESHLSVMGDVTTYGEDWHYSKRLGWVYGQSGDWPWMWTEGLGWIYYYSGREQVWFYRNEDGTYYYAPMAYPGWFYAEARGWMNSRG